MSRMGSAELSNQRNARRLSAGLRVYAHHRYQIYFTSSHFDASAINASGCFRIARPSHINSTAPITRSPDSILALHVLSVFFNFVIFATSFASWSWVRPVSLRLATITLARARCSRDLKAERVRRLGIDAP